MQKRAKLALVIGLAGLGSGCLSDEYRRADGLTEGAGEAIAANTVMQMVDPWQNGVQDTDLLVPADRGTTASVASSGGVRQSQTTSSSSEN